MGLSDKRNGTRGNNEMLAGIVAILATALLVYSGFGGIVSSKFFMAAMLFAASAALYYIHAVFHGDGASGLNQGAPAYPAFAPAGFATRCPREGVPFGHIQWMAAVDGSQGGSETGTQEDKKDNIGTEFVKSFSAELPEFFDFYKQCWLWGKHLRGELGNLSFSDWVFWYCMQNYAKSKVDSLAANLPKKSKDFVEEELKALDANMRKAEQHSNNLCSPNKDTKEREK